jgi:hypothetical protein
LVTNQLQILVSSYDGQVGECYLGEAEEEILEEESFVIGVEPRDI